MTKVLTGTYTAGYLLQAPIQKLSITATGFVEGSGITTPVGATAAYTISNSGRVVNTTGSGSGIDLTDGGRVTNGTAANTGASDGGYISGGDGVSIEGAPGRVTNFGELFGSASRAGGAGVYLGGGGGVINGSGTDLTATIAGYQGVDILNASGTVDNFGTIAGLAKSAIFFGDGGKVVNGSLTDTGALITGGGAGTGVSINGAGGAVNNFGTIVAGGNATGVILAAGGAVTNGAVDDTVAFIGSQGGIGVYAVFGTVTNFGTIAVDYQSGVLGVHSYGGTVINGNNNDTAALIGGKYGVSMYGPSATLKNFGTIGAQYRAVYLRTEGLIANGGGTDTVALIRTVDGPAVVSPGYATILSNFGTIDSVASDYNHAAGVLGGAAFHVVNGSAGDRSALIEGYAGIRLAGGGSVTNLGTVLGTGTTDTLGSAAGVCLVQGGSAVNGSGNDRQALIEGYNGVVLGLESVVTNFGTIEANGNGSSVLFRPAYSNTDSLIAEGGSTFLGVVSAGFGSVVVASGTANFAGGIATSGTVGGAGTLALSGATTFDQVSLTVAGVAILRSATTVDVEGALVYAGTWTQSAGTLSVADVGGLTFQGRADSFSGTLTGAGTVTFVGGSDTFDAVTLSASGFTISGARVTLEGAVALTSDLNASGDRFTIAADGATLSGGGTLALSEQSTNNITGAAPSATLTNVDDELAGSGRLGEGQMTFVNDIAGTIVETGANALVIDTGANTIVNAGLIEATGAGGITIQSAIRNDGMLAAVVGDLMANGVVTGSGAVTVNGGKVDFAALFIQNVGFEGAGVLEMAQSQAYSGTVTGFSTSGDDALDLGDILFDGATKASYSGTATSGVLTVTDSIRTAHINLSGDYTAATFSLSSDKHGGTTVVATQTAATADQRLPFIAAMAALGSGPGALEYLHAFAPHAPSMLLAARTQIA
jgi:hypothetical protein